jgi:apolipoprotein N-acyltransferase
VKRYLRQKKIQARKNFLPTLVLTICLWLSLATLVYFIDPDTALAIPVFFLVVFFALLFTFSTILANSRRGLVISSGLTVFSILRYLGIGHIINLLLIIAVAVTVELYFIKNGGA